MSSGSLSVDEKTAILIKSYELEPLPKLSLEIGEHATIDLLNAGQYLGHLIRERDLCWIGIDQKVHLLDKETARAIRDDPVYGYSHFIVDRGVANVFGKQIFEGKMPLEPAIGAASAIGIVEQDRQSGKTSVYTKKQLGIDSKSVRDIAKKFHSGTFEETKMSEIKDIDNKEKPIKENYELAREQILKRKADEEKKMLREEDMEPSWIKNDMDILIRQERKMEYIPDLKEDAESGMPMWGDRSEIIDMEKENNGEVEEDDNDDVEKESEEKIQETDELDEEEYILPFDEYDARDDEEIDKDYILPFNMKKKKEDSNNDIRLPF